MVYVLDILYCSLPTPTLIIKRVHHLTHFEFGLIRVTRRMWGRRARMLVFNASFKRYFVIPAPTRREFPEQLLMPDEETGILDLNPTLSQSQVKLLQLISGSKAETQLILKPMSSEMCGSQFYHISAGNLTNTVICIFLQL